MRFINGQSTVAVVAVIMTVLFATLLNWSWTSDVSMAIAENKTLLVKHNSDENLHLQKGIDGLPIMVTRTEFNALKASVDKNYTLLLTMAVKQGIDITDLVKKE